jgi:hypothetical protein
MTTTRPSGYEVLYSYNPSYEIAGSTGLSTSNTIDFGLPTQVAAASAISQADTSSRTPTKTFSYDAAGNVVHYGTGYNVGIPSQSNGSGSVTLTYDSMERPTAETDADNVVSTRTFSIEGTITSTTSAPQAAAGVSTLLTYDADGDEITETHYHGCVPGYLQYCVNGAQTLKWYDGADRLVEVQQPHDPRSDYYASPWMTRYIYDLSQAGTKYTLAIGSDSNLQAFGNLFQTQEYLPSLIYNATAPPTSLSWIATKGTTFDPLDRTIATYDVSMNGKPISVKSYDSAGQLGLLASEIDGLGVSKTWSYDADDRMSNVQFSDGTPNRSYGFDADGRVTTAISTLFGTETTMFDADGNISSVTEPQQGGITSPVSYQYTNYPDGLREYLTVSGSQAWNQLFGYSYRNDGILQTQALNWPGASGNYTFSYSSAGRKVSSTNPLTGLAWSGGVWGSESLSYDAYGRLTSWSGTTPNATRANMQYDEEGSPVYETFAGSNCGSNCTTTQLYNARGENWGTQYELASPVYTGQVTDKHLPQSLSFSANGYMIGSAAPYGGLVPPTTVDFNAADAVPITNFKSATFGYDLAARQKNQTSSIQPGGNGKPCGGSLSRTYDAENHLSGITFTNYNFWPGIDSCDPNTGSIGPTGSASYAWGANGHPLTASYTGVSTPNITLHWDGNTLLFVSGTGGSLLQLKAGPNHDDVVANGGITVFDRDPSGVIAGMHNATSSNGGTAGDDPFMQISTPLLNMSLSSFEKTPILEPRGDGIWDLYSVIQGVRNHDPISGSWTTPDAYNGDPHDPMSQKPFAWNRNNPVEYSDPSGYLPIIIPVQKEFEAWNNFVPLIAVLISRGVDQSIAQGMSHGEAARVWGTNASDSILRDVARNSKVGGLQKVTGTATTSEANEAGMRFVGAGARLAVGRGTPQAGRVWKSADGLRVYREPALKGSGEAAGDTQANFETKNNAGEVVSNVHLTIDNTR